MRCTISPVIFGKYIAFILAYFAMNRLRISLCHQLSELYFKCLLFMGESTLLMVFILLLLKIVAVRILLHDYYNRVLSLLYSVVEHENV